MIITFASPKGGVGKSTLCASLAGALAHRKNPVHILDLDLNETLYRWYTNHQPNIPGLTVEVVKPDPDIFSNAIDRIWNKVDGFIIIDLAGQLDAIMLHAAAVSNLVITPAKLSEPDIIEATKSLRHIGILAKRYRTPIPHRILINEVDAVDTHAQRFSLDQIAQSKLPRFETVIYKRTAYREIFISGRPPHFVAESSRVKKAVAELDTLTDEVLAVLQSTPQTQAVAS